VKDWDGRPLAEKFPEFATACYGTRHTATNHIVGHGWWSWWIPLKGGEMSVGVVFDQRLVQFPSGEARLGDRLRQFLSQHPVAAEMLEDAEFIEGDTHWRKNLPYSSTTVAGDGFALVGDAAAFLDPFYSPGMDWIAFSVSASVAMITAQQRGEELGPLLQEHNRLFTRSYQRWFEAVYKDKYEYMGDFELMRTVFRLDLGLYYLGIVSQPFLMGPKGLLQPPFATRGSVPVYHLMRTYNRRFAAMARERKRRGVWGKANHRQRFLVQSFSVSPSDAPQLLRPLFEWLMFELTEGWRTWFARKAAAEPSKAVGPAPATMPAN
jgi:hypothetical protein